MQNEEFDPIKEGNILLGRFDLFIKMRSSEGIGHTIVGRKMIWTEHVPIFEPQQAKDIMENLRYEIEKSYGDVYS